MEINNLIEELNNLKIIQTEEDWTKNIPSPYFEKYFEKMESEDWVDSGWEKYREISIEVFRIEAHLIGVRCVTDICDDCYWDDVEYELEFFEMKEIVKKTYKIK